ncbi:MAG: hypothetical protein HKN26_10925 [Acidimicrobiales bacterium]|nr:hypothetical protein [Acidimicrobiales bacterium]
MARTSRHRPKGGALLAIVVVTLFASLLVAAPAGAHHDDDELANLDLTPASTSTWERARQTYLLTDSVGLGAVEEIATGLSGALEWTGYPGFHLSAAPSVLTTVEAPTYGTVVIALGHNDNLSATSLRQRLSAMLEVLRDVPRVIFVRAHEWASYLARYNTVLDALLDKWANLELADWAGLAQPSHFWSDGIHLRPSGQQAFAELVIGHVKQTITAPNRRTVGHLDTVVSTPTGVRVSGWALDIDTESPIPVAFTIDGAIPKHGPELVTANRSRPDVDAVWNHGPNHGYVATIPKIRDGTHTVCAFGRDTATQALTELGCRSVNVAQQPVGELEMIRFVRGRVQVQGWAYDPRSDQPVLIRLRGDGHRLGSPYAVKPRPDVAALAEAGLSPNHGFKFTVPVPDEYSRFCVWAIDPQRGRNTRLGCLDR